MEGKPETDATQNFGHQSGLSGEKCSENINKQAFDLKKLQHGPQQHFPEDVRLGCCQS